MMKNKMNKYKTIKDKLKIIKIFGVLALISFYLYSSNVAFAKENMTETNVTEQNTTEQMNKRQTVKVGYYPLDGYYEKSDDGVLSGYGYELLQKISGYAGIDYEYVGYDNTWDELLQMLDLGEIDMLTSVQYTEDREKIFDYSNSPVGYSEAVLTTNTDKTKLISGDYHSYNHMRVGMMTGSALNEKMFVFAKQHDFSFEPVYFGTQWELEKALESGDTVDAIVNSSMNVLKEDCVLERFGRAPYYVVVKKGNTELLDKINYAISAMNANNPAWMTNLYKKYYAINDSYLYLNRNQQLYLEQLQNENKSVSVIIDPDLKPYSYFENGVAKGILVEYFNKICNFYGIEAEYIKVDTAEEYTNAVLAHKGDLVLAPYFLRYEADIDGYNLTQPFLKATLCLITRSDKTYDKDFADKKIAVVSGMTSVEQAGQQDFAKAKFVFYKTSDECIEAVKNEEADGTLLYNYMAYWYLNNNWDNAIQMFEMPDSSINFAIAVSKDCNPMMYELMDYAINAIPGNKLEAIVFSAILDTNRADESVWEYIKNRPRVLNTIVLMIAFIFLVIAVMMTNKYISVQRRKREEAEYDATHDVLTGAFNRLKLNDIMKNTAILSTKVGVMMLDIDYFKEINDTYGHDQGDKVLQQLVTILQTHFRGNDTIIRMGGDEFLIVMQDCDNAAWNSICDKLNCVHKSLNQEFSGQMSLTLSTGLYFSENGMHKEMMSKADAALYQTKKMGRAGCTLINEKEEVIQYWKAS